MDYLITGATGFIGHHLVEQLLADGNEVNYLARKRSKSLDSRAAFHLWNPGEMPPLDSVPTAEVVINLMGEPVAQRWSQEVKQRIVGSRVEGTRKLVSAIGSLKHKPRVLVSASATGYYGDRGDEVLTETSAPGTDFLADVCVQWEREALRAREFGLRVVILRIAPVLGRAGGIIAKMLPIFRAGLGAKLGSGKQWMPWIHISDLVRLLIYAAKTESMQGPYNASVPEPVKQAQFTDALGKALHRPVLFRAPKFALSLALGEAAGAMLASERVLPKATLEAGWVFNYPELSSALRQIVS